MTKKISHPDSEQLNDADVDAFERRPLPTVGRAAGEMPAPARI